MLSREVVAEKLKAVSIHLAISAAVFFVILYFILVHWYPQPYFSTDGGWQGIRLIASVDIVLGPLLTLVVYRKGKPRLKLDLMLIAVIQIGALISGSWVVYREHPVVVVFSEDRFIPVPAYQVLEAGLDLNDLKRFGNVAPQLAYLKLPENQTELADLRMSLFRKGQVLYLQSQLYTPFTNVEAGHIKQHAIDMRSFVAGDEKDRNTFDSFLEDYSGDPADLLFLRLHSRYKWWVCAFNTRTLQIFDVLPIDSPDLKSARSKLSKPIVGNPD